MANSHSDIKFKNSSYNNFCFINDFLFLRDWMQFKLVGRLGQWKIPFSQYVVGSLHFRGVYRVGNYNSYHFHVLVSLVPNKALEKNPINVELSIADLILISIQCIP